MDEHFRVFSNSSLGRGALQVSGVSEIMRVTSTVDTGRTGNNARNRHQNCTHASGEGAGRNVPNIRDCPASVYVSYVEVKPSVNIGRHASKTDGRVSDFYDDSPPPKPAMSFIVRLMAAPHEK